MTCLEIQDGVQPAVDADQPADSPDREESAVDVWDRATPRVVSDRQLLVWSGIPKIISALMTKPGTRTEWICDPASVDHALRPAQSSGRLERL